MTDRLKRPPVFLEAELPTKCELCGAHQETRPYGPNGERICFDCGMNNESATKRRFSEVLTGKKLS